MLANMKHVFLVMMIGTFVIQFPNSKTTWYVNTTKSIFIGTLPSLIAGTEHPIKYASGFVVVFRCFHAVST